LSRSHHDGAGRKRPAAPARAGLWALLVAVASLTVGSIAAAQGPVSAVLIRGNHRVEETSIRVHVSQPVGVPVDDAAVDRDIKEIYRMGFFDDVWATHETGEEGQVVVYNVAERPYITDIKFKGVKKVNEEDLEAVVNLTPRTIFDPQRAWVGIEEARKFYTSEGYPDVRITYELEAGAEDTAVLHYKVDEGKLVRVQDIRLEGVQAFSKRKLRRLMTTRQEWFMSFATGAGLLNEDELATDMERLTAFYYDNGYIHARVDEPQVTREEEGLVITVKVEEGPLFHVGEISFDGDVELPEDELRYLSGVATGDVFRASVLREAIFALSEAYGDLGYAFAEAVPDTRVSDAREEVDVVFTFRAGPIVKIRRIEIRGNTKTRDHVIRRELTLQEGQTFSGSGLRRSKVAVNRLGFFDEVELTTSRTSQPDEVDLLVQVKEGRTGSFSAGAGFSSADSLLFNTRVSEQNLFGRGQRMVVNADLGTIRRNLQLSFTEPWFLNRPLVAGFDVFFWELDFDRFTRGSTGFGLRASYPLHNLGLRSFYGMSLNRVRAGLEYRLENADINGVSLRAPPDVKDEEGTRLTSSITPTLSRNTLNHPFDPSRGSRQSFGFKVAGLGGDADYVKVDASSRWFIPTFSIYGRQITYSLGARLGFGLGDTGDSGEELPLFERYFPGGINSVRGYDARKLGPTQDACGRTGKPEKPNKNCRNEEIGGSQQLILNNELIFPIIRDAGLKGVVFFDAGNAFLADDGIRHDDIKYAAGWGFRWLSPFGPLRVEIGYPLNPGKRKGGSVVLFSFGSPF